MSIIDEIKKQVPYEEVLNQFNLDTSIPPDITIDRLAPNNYLTIVWKDKITDSIYNTYEDIISSQHTTEIKYEQFQVFESQKERRKEYKAWHFYNKYRSFLLTLFHLGCFFQS